MSRGRKPGFKMTPEQVEKMRKALTGRKLSPEHIRRSAEGHRGKPSGMLGKKQSAHFLEVRKNQVWTAETNKKRSESLKKAYASGKKVASFKGKKIPIETRRKMSTSHKLFVATGLHHWWKGGITPTYKVRRKELTLKNGGGHTLGEWENLKAQVNWYCIACGKQEPEIKLTKDHIIPIIRGGSSNIENIQPLCGPCNSRKNDKVF